MTDRAREIAERVVRLVPGNHWAAEPMHAAIISACHEYAAPIVRERDEAVQQRDSLDVLQCADMEELRAKLARVEAVCRDGLLAELRMLAPLLRIPGDPAAIERLCAAAVEYVRAQKSRSRDRQDVATKERSAATFAYAATVPTAKKRGKKGSV